MFVVILNDPEQPTHTGYLGFLSLTPPTYAMHNLLEYLSYGHIASWMSPELDNVEYGFVVADPENRERDTWVPGGDHQIVRIMSIVDPAMYAECEAAEKRGVDEAHRMLYWAPESAEFLPQIFETRTSRMNLQRELAALRAEVGAAAGRYRPRSLSGPRVALSAVRARKW